MEQQELSFLAGGKAKMVQPLWKTFWCFLKKLNIVLPDDPAITLLGIYPKEMKTYVHTKTCIELHIAALFIIAKWKQPKDVLQSVSDE